jgi:hypothetical protein
MTPEAFAAGPLDLDHRRVAATGRGGDRADGAADEQFLVADEQHDAGQVVGQVVDADRACGHGSILALGTDTARSPGLASSDVAPEVGPASAAGAPSPTVLGGGPRTTADIDPRSATTATSPSRSVRRTGTPSRASSPSSTGEGCP